MIDSMTTVGQIMTSPVMTVQPDDVMSKVSDIFETTTVHHIPVVKNKKVIGIISKGDYYKLQHNFTFFKLTKSTDFNKDIMRSLLVGEVMTKQVAVLHPSDKVTTAAAIFRENLFHAIPIVDEQQNLVGIVTTYDMINFAFTELSLLAPVYYGPASPTNYSIS